MSKNTLDNLFGSKVRVKVLKYLFRNYPGDFSISELARRVQEPLSAVTKEVKGLNDIELIVKNGKKTQQHYSLNPQFEFFQELRALILKASPAEKDKMVDRISKLGRIKLAVVSGIFLGNEAQGYASVADLFIVGDDIDRKKVGNFLRALEAEVGKEIRFGIMEKEEFDYRYDMFDRFVRVLLEGPHEKIINKIGL